MLHYLQRAIRRQRDDKGASAVEYGLLVAAIAAVIVAVVFVLGTLVKGGFSTTCSELNTQAAAGQNCS